MIAQYVAAALVSENKVARASGVGRLDPVERGPGGSRLDGHAAALKALQVVANAERVLAIELLAGAQARRVPRAARAGGRRASRAVVRPDPVGSGCARTDRSSADIERVAASIRDGRLLAAVAAELASDGRMSDLPPPRQPYRSAALFNGGLAAVIVLFAASRGDLRKAVAVACSTSSSRRPGPGSGSANERQSRPAAQRGATRAAGTPA